MKRPGPLLTLLAGLLLGLFLLTLDATTGSRHTVPTYKERSPVPTPAGSATSPAPTPSRARIADASYAGRTDDDSSSVAVSIRGGKAIAYLRGAKIDGGWIVLSDGRQVGILSRDGKAGAAPRIDPATGAVTVDGERLTARPVTP
ncbi:hypothetical protein AB0I54_15840 [Streptomyces sp. NPDC050625]|uniref:hypothetical protein n=1 Tax=Streptomyces sp. NPDC050625 TaxID=3154629 RepID=UPI00342C93D2